MSNPDTSALVIEAALKRMVASGHFSICTIDEIIKLTGVVPDGNAHQQLRLLHCVDFKDMPRDLQARLPALISACVNGPTLEFTVTVKSEPAPTFIEIREEKPRRRLLGFLAR